MLTLLGGKIAEVTLTGGVVQILGVLSFRVVVVLSVDSRSLGILGETRLHVLVALFAFSKPSLQTGTHGSFVLGVS